MRHPLGRDQQVARGHRKLPTVEQEQAAAFDDLVHLVHVLVGMKRVRLPGFKSVQADEHARRLEQRGFSHFFRAPLRVIPGSDYCGMVHTDQFAMARRSACRIGISFEATATVQSR